MSHGGTEEFYKERVPLFGFLIGWMSGNDMDYGPVAFAVAASLLVLALFIFGVSGGQILSVFFAIIPIWLPIILFLLFFEKWNEMVGLKFYLNNGRTTLRIKLPQEVTKSPEAMEFVIAQIHNTANPDNLMQTYLDGKRPLPFSFEIVSIGGELRFYVNVPTKKTKDAFEANMYAQYPGIEIVEEPVDYAAEIPGSFDPSKTTVFAVHMGKKKDGFLPIKSYVEYKLDTMPKEEEKVDPITPMLEVFASLKQHERLYMQIIATSYRKSSFKMGQLMLGEGPDWNKPLFEYINKLLNRDPDKRTSLGDGQFEEQTRLTPGERDTITAMERNADKYAYNVGIRWLYINKEGGFNGDLINPVIRSFSQYDINTRNQIGVRWRTDLNYKDLIPGSKKRIDSMRKAELKLYKLRKYFNNSGADEPKIFTSEELATMFHVPGKVAMTPTLNRIESTRSEAPSNLPTMPQ
ncbi:MAG: hypothetical protein R3B69_00790 [Candidatus Paceibacterota bacterium]